MGIWQWVKKVTVKIFWPWFKDAAWPFILQYMKDLIFFVNDLFKENLKKWVSQQAIDKEEKAAPHKNLYIDMPKNDWFLHGGFAPKLPGFCALMSIPEFLV